MIYKVFSFSEQSRKTYSEAGFYDPTRDQLLTGIKLVANYA